MNNEDKEVMIFISALILGIFVLMLCAFYQGKKVGNTFAEKQEMQQALKTGVLSVGVNTTGVKK